MQKLLTAIFLISCSFFAFSQEVDSEYIFFEQDEFTLTTSALEKIDQTINQWNQYSEYSIQILGHTDQDGTSKYNEVLAQKRANEVYQKLLEKGISADQMLLSSFGETQLLELENVDSQAAKAKNRRVELIVTYLTFNSTDDLIGQLHSGSSQLFRKKAGRDIELILAEGSTVKLKANSLVHLDGTPVKGDIDIVAKEAFDFNQFAQFNLSCQSDDKFLESGGMLYVGISSEGRELKLKEGATMEVKYPIQNSKPNMELFYGEQIEDEGSVNWVLAENKVEVETMSADELGVELEWDKLLTPQVDLPNEPIFDIERIEPHPRSPRKPYAPVKPQLVQKEQVSLGLNKKQKILYSARKKDKIRTAKYEKLVEQHERALEEYEIKYKRYQELVQLYADQLVKYKEDVACWNEKVDEKILEIKEFRIEYSKYRMDLSAHHAQRFLKKNIGEQMDEKKIQIFAKILHEYESSLQVVPFYKRVFGPRFREVFKKVGVENRNYYFSKYENQSENLVELKHKYYKLMSTARLLNRGNINANRLGAYAMNVSKLGWMNCDRFSNFEGRRMDFALQANKDEQFYMVFNDLRTLITPQKSDSGFTFGNIPIEYDVTIVGIKIENGKPMLYHQAFQENQDVNLVPSFRVSSLKEIQQLMNRLDSNT